MNEVTLVTAYFNIGRGEWKELGRGNDKYLTYFKHWARIRNRLIVYTFPEMVEKVKDVRRSFGLEDKTVVIPVNDITAIQPQMYERIKEVMKNKESWRFHKRLFNPESWNYRYNYIMAIKAFFLKDAVERGLAHGMMAWIDFGYDHGGDNFPYKEDFDFLWQYNFEPKIHVFLENSLDDDIPVFRIVQNMQVYVRGSLIVAPDELWKTLWDIIQDAVFTLADCGLADDDQLLMVMAYRKRPELFMPHQTRFWGEGLYAYGGHHLRVKLPQKKKFMKIHELNRKAKRYLKGMGKEIDISLRKGKEIEKKYYSD